jgi:hypothetical protein
MRDFLNRDEIQLTGIVLASKVYLKNYSECEYLNDFERKKLNYAIKHLEEFQASILARTDRVYLKRLKSITDNNELYFAPKGLNRKIVEEVDDEIIGELLSESGWAFDCFDCNKQDYHKCNCYKVYASVGKEPTNCKDGECPFR